MKRKLAMRSNDSTTELFYQGAEVPMSAIRHFARQVAKQFEPDKIILFGSFAYGVPNEASDVDILVIMPARNEIAQAIKIRMAIDAPFAMDLIVRTPSNMAWRLAEGESFGTEIVTKGKVLHEKTDRGMDSQGGRRLSTRANNRARKRVVS